MASRTPSSRSLTSVTVTVGPNVSSRTALLSSGTPDFHRTSTALVTEILTALSLLAAIALAAREAFQPRQLPVGVLTGVVGGIYLAGLLAREWRKGRA